MLHDKISNKFSKCWRRRLMALQKQGSERWREIEHIQIWVRRNFSHVLTWSIKAWVAGRAGSYRQKETGALCCFALRRPPKLTISGERERRPKMKKSAAVLTYLLRHSSEIRGLCLMKLSSESPQNLPCFWKKKTRSFLIPSNLFGFFLIPKM